MRITNRMMTNNMLSNINKNKITMSKLEEQYISGKKIQRPSDDPIITVRALKLRTNLSELEQYYEKNIPDAVSWMKLTESSLETINDALKEINTYCVQGSSDQLTADNRDAIVKNLSQLRDQIYEEGNSNYAGRYIFTGYKTDSSLTFSEDTKNYLYKITENFTGTDIQMVSRVTGGYDLDDYDDPAVKFDKAPQLETSYILKLSYDNLKDTPIDKIVYGNDTITNITTILSNDPDAYNPADGSVNFIYDTGELVLSKDIYEKLRKAKDIEVTYEKSDFGKGELKPEHYFNCTRTDTGDTSLKPIDFKNGKDNKQVIEYEVYYGQKLAINTLASDAISHKIGRDIDDIIKSVSDVKETEDKISEIEKRLKDTNLSNDEIERYKDMLEQLNTELTLRKEVMQSAFARGITSSYNEIDRVNVALADLGSREFRLELIENRLLSQKTDFTELLSTNEDADITETIINFNSAYMIYNASLSATSKLAQNTLLNFL